jgi:hypothetical protein
MKTFKFRLVNEETGEKQIFVVQDHVFAGAASKAYIEKAKKGFEQPWKIEALWRVAEYTDEA